MTGFTVSYSPALDELIQHEGFQCTGVEVGPYFSLSEVKRICRKLTGWRVEFHASYLGLLPFTRPLLQSYLKATQSRWVSCHVRLLSTLQIWLGLHARIYLPPSNPAQNQRKMIETALRLKQWAPLPLILENMPCRHLNQRIEADPGITCEVLQATGCDLLLDLAHARVGAMFFGMQPADYLELLPLDKVRQIHVSGPRMRGDTLYDAHESMNEEDYRLLEWTLARTHPEVVTLEYFRDRDALREQIHRIMSILGQS